MRILLSLLVILVAVMNASASFNCFLDAKLCEDEECCIQIGATPAGICKLRHDVGDICEMKPVKNLFKDHVYKIRCPCYEDLKCVSSKGGLVGKVLGKCQKDSGESEATDTPKPETKPEPEE